MQPSNTLTHLSNLVLKYSISRFCNSPDKSHLQWQGQRDIKGNNTLCHTLLNMHTAHYQSSIPNQEPGTYVSHIASYELDPPTGLHCGDSLTILHILAACPHSARRSCERFRIFYNCHIPLHPALLLCDEIFVAFDRVTEFLARHLELHSCEWTWSES